MIIPKQLLNAKICNEENCKKIIIMKKYLELITDLGYDYDGLNSVESLKALIDELVRLANLGRVCNIIEPIYENGGKKYNILMEKTE